MRSCDAALHTLCDTQREVSAHYLISEAGRVWQLVDESRRAWHAGVGAWGRVTDVNSRSIGIELANNGAQPFAEPQMIALETLLEGILARWSIPTERVLGHSDVAIGRKIDPGPRFDWRRLARRGLAVWPEPGRPGDLAADARRAGYVWSDGQDGALLQALRMRLRPWAQGPEDDTDRALVASLAARWPAAT
ncbi:N-acetylmuramoyl-L-alanine amidase [Roseivivax sediminis]|uniref:N-acetylmuramoyl-L-alanine amidase n=1 Tax=Roseivivax sediminis TaxID=936889 RepID=A0A1I1X226_9RHOB|nr:N-acetylmuramoyl-L-alanine amidase [Roseivivax sediminis]SFE01382.1 N-acetylmuramoyl-L-alanine amidase [Roseivivax sediminis]